MTVMEFGNGDVFLSMLWFFLFFIWIWLLITVFADIFRSDDLGGWSKAIWLFFVILVPYLGVLVYLIARGHKMSEHAAKAAQQQQDQMREYVQSVAGTSGSTSAAEEIARLHDLQQQGATSQEEFEAAKAKLLA